MDISGWIRHWGNWIPDKTALRFEGRSLSYGELEQAVESVARWLRANGVSSGDRVAYLGPSCPELLELLFASARLGAIFVPLNNRMPSAELRVLVEATRPRLLVAEEGFRRVALDSVDNAWADRVKTVGEDRELARSVPAAERPATSGSDGSAPVLILFTSGTTGRAKGATFTHENIEFNALKMITAFGLTAADEVLTAVPMFHSGGLLIHTTPALCCGATITIHRQFDPRLLLEEVERERITLLACTPAMTFQLADHAVWDEADLSSLRCVLTGSTVVPRTAIEPWQRKGVTIVQGYGMTEICVIATTMPPDSAPESAFTAGKPVLHTQIRVVDESGQDAPAGQPGEVWFRGPSMMSGYWENPQATQEAFCDGWLRSGDIGLLDRDGFLHIVDRLKDIIIVGSSNVCPSDLELVLHGCPEIREAAVVGRSDDELGEVPVACVVLTPGRTLGPDQVIALYENRLATYKHPRDVIFLDALPRNSTGKVDRRLLRDIVTRNGAGFHACARRP
jgi:fatty-acyl-CoA synthase